MEDRRMNSLADMIWVEWRKAARSRMPLWTVLASLFMPLGIAFLIFVARNRGLQAPWLVSAKAIHRVLRHGQAGLLVRCSARSSPSGGFCSSFSS